MLPAEGGEQAPAVRGPLEALLLNGLGRNAELRTPCCAHPAVSLNNQEQLTPVQFWPVWTWLPDWLPCRTLSWI